MTILDSSHHTTPASREEMCQMDKEGRGCASLATQSLPGHAPTQGRRERLLSRKTARGDPPITVPPRPRAHPPQPPDTEQKWAGREGKGVQAEGTHTSKNTKMRDHVKERAQTSSFIRVPGGPAGQGLGWE